MKIWTVTLSIMDANGDDDEATRFSAIEVSAIVKRELETSLPNCFMLAEVNTCLGKPMQELSSVRRTRPQLRTEAEQLRLNRASLVNRGNTWDEMAENSGSRCGHEDAPCCGC